MAWIPDASVAGKWHLNENLSAKAKALLLADPDTLAPDFLLPEFINTLSRNIREGKFAAEDAPGALAQLRLQVPRLVPVDELLIPALEMSVELRHPVYDCFYLALAARTGKQLVTDDRVFYRKVVASRWRDNIALLSDCGF